MATLGTEKNGHCRELAVVESLTQERTYGLSAEKKKNGRCREVAVSGDSTVADNRKERPYLVL